MARYDVHCIGNAIVDVIASCGEGFLAENGIVKGAMNLVDAARAEALYARMDMPVETSGGSAGNTAAGVAGFGGRAAYSGKVADDGLGRVFSRDIRAQGVAFETGPLVGGPQTARCMVFVTPDGERSMNTYLGACTEIGPEDIGAGMAADAKVVFFEGYLWDHAPASEAVKLAAALAHAAGNEVAMTLSDPLCVDRHRDGFMGMLRSGAVDLVFANESELKSLYRTESFDEAIDAVRRDCKVAAVTRSGEGSVVIGRGRTVKVEAMAIRELVDTIGAGDAYAAGFLHGYTTGRDPIHCGRLGSLAAGLVIQQVGPRAGVNLALAAREAGLA